MLKFKAFGLSVILIAFVLIFFFFIPSPQPVEGNVFKREEDLVRRAPANVQVWYYTHEFTSETVVTPKLAFNCAKEETSYNPMDWKYNSAQSSSQNAHGPYQIQPICARDVWGTKLKGLSDTQIAHRLKHDIKFNVETGIRYMDKLYKQYGDWKIVFSIYNQGMVGKTRINQYALNIVGK